MKKIVLIIPIFLIAGLVHAQVGIGTETPDAATELHVVAPDGSTGVLLPSVTTAQMNNMTSASHGMLVFNSDKQKFMYNAGDATTQIWTFVGDIPVVADITTFTTGVKGDIRYSQHNDQLFYWNGSVWSQIKSEVGP